MLLHSHSQIEEDRFRRNQEAQSRIEIVDPDDILVISESAIDTAHERAKELGVDVDEVDLRTFISSRTHSAHY